MPVIRFKPERDEFQLIEYIDKKLSSEVKKLSSEVLTVDKNQDTTKLFNEIKQIINDQDRCVNVNISTYPVFTTAVEEIGGDNIKYIHTLDSYTEQKD